MADAKSLSGKLGRNDKDTLDEFMTMVRDIEIRMVRLRKLVAEAGIDRPTDEVLPRGEYIKLQCDLMIAALQMGITNVTTMMIGPERWNAPMLYESVFDKPVVHHSMSHSQRGDGYAKLQKLDLFHMEKYDYVLIPNEEFEGDRRIFHARQFSRRLRGGAGRWGHSPIF